MRAFCLSLGWLLLAFATPSAVGSTACRDAPALACLAGRPGGQRLQGGTDAGDPLTLAGPGPIRLDGPTTVWPSMPDTGGAMMSMAPARSLTGPGLVGLDISPAFRWTRPGGFFGLRFGGMHEVDVDPTAVNFMAALHVNYVSRSTTDGVAPWFPDMIIEQWTAQLDGPGRSATTGLIPIAFDAIPVVKATNGASLAIRDRCALACGLGTNAPCREAAQVADCTGCASGTVDACSDRGGLITIYAYPTLHADDGSSLSVVRRAVVFDRGVRLDAAGSGAVTLETDNTVYIADRSGAETVRAIESRLGAGDRKFFLYGAGDAPSVHAGRLRIGDTAAPEAALDLASGRDRHLRMAGAAEDPAEALPGDVWYSTSQQAHRTRAGVGTLGLTGVLATITADSEAVGRGSGETRFSNGAFPVPGNTLARGKTIRLRAGGRYSNPAAASLRLTLRWGAGGTSADNLLVDTGAVVVPGGVVDGGWTLDADVTVRAAGPAGSAVARGVATFGGAGTPAVIATDARPGATAIDTSVEMPLTLSSAWDAQAEGSIVLEMATLEILD